jgi:hypothetical protein
VQVKKRRGYPLRRRRVRRDYRRIGLIIGFSALALALAVGVFFLVRALVSPDGRTPDEVASQSDSPTVSATDGASVSPSLEPTPEPTPAPTLAPDLAPHAIEGETDPGTFGFETHIYVDDAEVQSYSRPDPISFGAGG